MQLNGGDEFKDVAAKVTFVWRYRAGEQRRRNTVSHRMISGFCLCVERHSTREWMGWDAGCGDGDDVSAPGNPQTAENTTSSDSAETLVPRYTPPYEDSGTS